MSASCIRNVLESLASSEPGLDGTVNYGFAVDVYRDVMERIPRWREDSFLSSIVSEMLTATINTIGYHTEKMVQPIAGASDCINIELLSLSVHWWVLLVCDEVLLPTQIQKIRQLMQLMVAFTRSSSLATYCRTQTCLNSSSSSSQISSSAVLFALQAIDTLLKELNSDKKIQPTPLTLRDGAVLVSMIRVLCTAFPERLELIHDRGCTILHYAASLSMEGTDATLDAHSCSDRPSDNCAAADLAVFCRYISFGVVQTIVHFCPKIANIPNVNGYLPLHCAADCNNSEVLLFLAQMSPSSLRSRTRLGETPLQFVLSRMTLDISNESCSVIKKLLAMDPTICATSCILGFFPLHHAIRNCAVPLDLVMAILFESVGLLFSRSGLFCLTTAIRLIGMPRASGSSQLETTPNKDNELLVLALLQHCPQLASICDKFGRYPIHYAAGNRFVTLSMLKYIDDMYPAAFQSPDLKGNSALHWLLQSNRSAFDLETVLRWLFRSGNSSTLGNKNIAGSTPYQLWPQAHRFPQLKSTFIPSNDEDYSTVHRMLLSYAPTLSDAHRALLHDLNWSFRRTFLCCLARVNSLAIRTRRVGLNVAQLQSMVMSGPKRKRNDADVDAEGNYSKRKRYLSIGPDAIVASRPKSMEDPLVYILLRLQSRDIIQYIASYL